MVYITGLHALNIECSLCTPGDWHMSALNWDNLKLKESKKSIFRDYGIETGRTVPEHAEEYNVANHIRAVLDMIEEGNFGVVQGFKEDFICNDKYTEEIFEQVLKLKDNSNWEDIKKFMGREYKLLWLDYIGE